MQKPHVPTVVSVAAVVVVILIAYHLAFHK